MTTCASLPLKPPSIIQCVLIFVCIASNTLRDVSHSREAKRRRLSVDAEASTAKVQCSALPRHLLITSECDWGVLKWLSQVRPSGV